MVSAVVLVPEQHSVGGFSLSWLVDGFPDPTALCVPLLHSNPRVQQTALKHAVRRHGLAGAF
jgi:hypothetical protein